MVKTKVIYCGRGPRSHNANTQARDKAPLPFLFPTNHKHPFSAQAFYNYAIISFPSKQNQILDISLY